jgi:hypothetical protein
VCITQRISTRIHDHIPESKAAYGPGRSTTEHVFTVKTICDLAISTTDFTANILLLDMTKAFDTVDRRKLYMYLQDILNKDELHLIHILLHDVELRVRNGQTTGTPFTTNIGMPQGDGLSALFFIYYVYKSLLPLTDIDLIHNIDSKLSIDLQYSDDISFITEDKRKMDILTNLLPTILKQNNLTVNPTKTERYEVTETQRQQ